MHLGARKILTSALETGLAFCTLPSEYPKGVIIGKPLIANNDRVCQLD